MNKENWNLIVVILFFFSYYFFFLSLEKCIEGEDICCMKFEWIKKKIIEESLSCILTIILLELIILKKISKLHLIHFILVFIFFFRYSNGIDFDDHGYYNIKYFFLIVISILIILFIMKQLLSIHKTIFRLCVISLLIFLYLILNVFGKYINCNDWEIGLNNTAIDNNIKKYECLIQIPKSCPYKIGKYFFDKNRYKKLDCSKKFDNAWENIINYSKSPFVNNNTRHIGLPLINKEEKFFSDMDFSTFRNYIRESFVDMNNLTLLNLLNERKPEISIDFSGNINGKMNINLNFNKTLSRERKNLEKLTNPYSNNILILYIDSVSRAYSMRQLKKTLQFFEKFISFQGNFNKDYPNEYFHSFQFFKYYSHKYYTAGNYPILFYGRYRNQTNKYITFYLKRNGFITGYSADLCFNDFTRTYHNFSFDDIYDHQYIVCDPKYQNPWKFSCLYGKLHAEYMFEYINQFWRKYKDNRKFTLLLTNFAHEGTLEKLKYIDKIIY